MLRIDRFREAESGQVVGRGRKVTADGPGVSYGMTCLVVIYLNKAYFWKPVEDLEGKATGAEGWGDNPP